MRLPRPYIPLDVRIAVARRQLRLGHDWNLSNYSLEKKLKMLLLCLFGAEKYHLDHDPALMLRDIVRTKDGKLKYMPDANDPDFLIYRERQDHRIKTIVRGDGAQRSDLSQRRYLKRIATKQSRRRKFKPRRAKHIRRFKDAPIP
jgi:hypothetical protein